ncbi:MULTISPECIES: hypothetical protein [Streptomyces]|uniref:Uncharacterized protein n=1 Tax=Streptomyces doudnae TaxID=3075536 RepID=A0ABD5EFQ3_9ACTN|nr:MULTISPECIES: hypothetical protein [unclassified Streptomyces]MDT0433197.1 hypothetical protein [Streptomyces sp. DSM 41981]MYQ63165.1 hypothetical protein [Streptomyces sp. SID4950]
MNEDGRQPHAGGEGGNYNLHADNGGTFLQGNNNVGNTFNASRSRLEILLEDAAREKKRAHFKGLEESAKSGQNVCFAAFLAIIALAKFSDLTSSWPNESLRNTSLVLTVVFYAIKVYWGRKKDKV